LPAQSIEGERPRQSIDIHAVASKIRHGAHGIDDRLLLACGRIQPFESLLGWRATIVEDYESSVIKPRGRGNTCNRPAFRTEDPFNRELPFARLSQCVCYTTHQEKKAC
jgi:hypothetical protein